MQDGKHRVLVVSGRLLVAQGLKSLLVGEPEIRQVEVIGNLYDALVYCRDNMPDVMVIDLPAGADLFVDRPVSIEGHEIKTIVLLEGDKNGQARLYVHTPGKAANLENLMGAILLDSQDRSTKNLEGQALAGGGIQALMDTPNAAPSAPQPSSFIRAKASGPSKSRIPASRPES